MSNKHNRLIEEEFISEKASRRDFSADARQLARNKRSKKGLMRIVNSVGNMFSSF